MIRAFAHTSGSSAEDFDAEPFFAHHREFRDGWPDHGTIDSVPGLTGWVHLRLDMGRECFQWTLNNHPTPALARLERAWDLSNGLWVCINKEDGDRWIQRYITKRLSKSAVDNLLGGEP